MHTKDKKTCIQAKRTNAQYANTQNTKTQA